MSDPLDDPRARPAETAPTLDELEDARPRRGGDTCARRRLWLTVGGAAALGLLAFIWLATNRDHRAEDGALPTSGSVAARETVASAPLPNELSLEEAAGRAGPVAVAAPLPPPEFVAPPAHGPSSASRDTDRRAAVDQPSPPRWWWISPRATGRRARRQRPEPRERRRQRATARRPSSLERPEQPASTPTSSSPTGSRRRNPNTPKPSSFITARPSFPKARQLPASWKPRWIPTCPAIPARWSAAMCAVSTVPKS